MANDITNWVHVHRESEHKRAQRILKKVKNSRGLKTFKMVQVGPKTWKEVEVNDEV
jgi:hypothetical protein